MYLSGASITVVGSEYYKKNEPTPTTAGDITAKGSTDEGAVTSTEIYRGRFRNIDIVC